MTSVPPDGMAPAPGPVVISQESAAERVAGRPGHFMPASLVSSQFADLEPLRDENGLETDATRPPEEIIAAVTKALPLRP